MNVKTSIEDEWGLYRSRKSLEGELGEWNPQHFIRSNCCRQLDAGH